MEETIVPYERRKDVWSIILRGTQSPDPTVQHEKEYGGDNMDPFTMSINTTRGESFHALIRYSYWVNKNEDSKSLPTEVTQVLDDHLDNDPSQTIYSVYGRYFGFLYGNNSKWVKENLDRIFPDDFNNPLWKASFGTYLMSTMYADLFLILKKQYLKALSFAEAHTEEKNDGFNFTDKLSNHVAWAVAYGTDGHSEIAKELFKNKNESLKNHMIWYIGANILKPELAKIKEDEYPNPNNLKWIWEGELDNLAPDIAKNFGWWFVNSPYSRGFNIKQLVKTLKVSGGLVEPDHKILEGISTYAEEFPEEVMICLDLLVKNKDKHWPMKFRVGSYESIMDKIKPIANDSTKQKIVAVADYLGKMGFSEFKKFVQ